MGEVAKCVGCAKPGGPVCLECRELSIGPRSVSSVRTTLWIALALDAVFTSALLSFALADGFLIGHDALMLFAFFLAGSGAWTLRELRRPIGFELRADCLVVLFSFRVRRWLPLALLQNEGGVVVDMKTRTRYRVGEDRFPGAAEFHRALRVRLALLEPSTRDPAVS